MRRYRLLKLIEAKPESQGGSNAADVISSNNEIEDTVAADKKRMNDMAKAAPTSVRWGKVPGTVTLNVFKDGRSETEKEARTDEAESGRKLINKFLKVALAMLMVERGEADNTIDNFNNDRQWSEQLSI